MGYTPPRRKRDLNGDLYCRLCGQFKPPDQFHLNRNRPDGRQLYCRACMRRYYPDGQRVKDPDSQPEPMPLPPVSNIAGSMTFAFAREQCFFCPLIGICRNSLSARCVPYSRGHAEFVKAVREHEQLYC
jgi:hypothetical protein